MRFKVTLIESERGCGQKVVGTKFFPSADEAWEFVDDFNKRNDGDTVPDWYMVATDPVRIS